MITKNAEKLNSSHDWRFDSLALGLALLLALGARLPGLTTFLTADEARSWFGRSIIFLDSLTRGDLANTGPGGTATFIESVSLSPAPGVTTMWTGALGIVLEYIRQGMPGSLNQFLLTLPFDPLDPDMLLSLRLLNVLLAGLAVALTYWWSRPFLGRWGALLVAIFVALDPFYLALSRVLGHDGLVTTFMWLSLLGFLRALASPVKKADSISDPTPDIPLDTVSSARQGFLLYPQRRFLMLSGGFAGLAFLSKYPALFIGAFIAVSMLIVYLHQSSWSNIGSVLARWLFDMMVWSVSAGVIFVLVWPAMWVDPLGPITAIVNDALRASGSPHQKGSFFLGEPVPDPGLFFYPLIILLRTTPIIFFGLLLSIWLLFRQGRRVLASEQNRPSNQENALSITPLFLILLAYVVLYTLLVTYGGKKQDRYLLPAFPALMMLATLGYLYLMQLRFSNWRQSWLIPLALIGLQIALIFPYQPYYFSYYNSFIGGGAAASNLVQVGWGEGLNEAAAYLNTLPNAESTQVVSWYSTTFEPYFAGQAIYKIEDEKISRSAKPGLAADYVVFYVNQLQRELPTAGAIQFFQSTSPVYTVTLQGVDYAWVYPSVAMTHVLPDEVRLVGQAELLGYNLMTEAGDPTTITTPESVLLLSLYWEWQGKAEDEVIRLSLVDDAGETKGWGNHIETAAPLPFNQWLEGMIVRDDFALVIFPDTTPGDYHLSVWVERPATGETVGVFPMDKQVTIQIVPREQG